MLVFYIIGYLLCCVVRYSIMKYQVMKYGKVLLVITDFPHANVQWGGNIHYEDRLSLAIKLNPRRSAHSGMFKWVPVDYITNFVFGSQAFLWLFYPVTAPLTIICYLIHRTILKLEIAFTKLSDDLKEDLEKASEVAS